MSELTRLNAVEIIQRIEQREVSVTEVVDTHLQTIEAVNPIINALTDVDHSSLELAANIDNQQRPTTLPTLYGLPVTTKSNVDQSGFVNANGVPAFKDNRCNSDSPVVSNLKHSGAIIVGRSNTPEFSMRWFTSNPLYGTSLNPWRHDITPGGSSGGAAAAVAAGMCTIGHGNDLGGSLRYPAFCCGVTSLKPTAHRIPAYNPCAAAERPSITQTMSVQGPIARCVSDLRLGFQSMARGASGDPLWSGHPESGRTHARQLRIGYCLNPYTSDLDPAIESAMQIALNGLRDTSAELVEKTPPDAEAVAELWGRLLFTEASTMLGESFKQHASQAMLNLLEQFEKRYEMLDLAGLLQGMSERIQHQRAWSLMFDDIDILLMPTSLSRPFANDLDFDNPDAIPAIIDAQKPLYTINLLGLPALAIPTNTVDGIPLGVQLIAAKNDDEFLLDTAESLERVIGTLVQQMPSATG